MCSRSASNPETPAPAPPPVVSTLQIGSNPNNEELLRVRSGNNRSSLRSRDTSRDTSIQPIRPIAPRPNSSGTSRQRSTS